MTATMERYAPTKTAGDEALDTINRHREQMGDVFELRELDTEFAFYMQRLGLTGLFLADAADNDAGTFKWRGALNKMTAMKEQGKDVGIVPSAGNHLRGAVLAGKALDIVVHGFVPTSAPSKKTDGARKLAEGGPGFHLHVVGGTFDESLAHAQRAAETVGDMVHPFDDPLVSAGQGTIADDIFDEGLRRGVGIRHVVVPVGGRGLMQGLAQRFQEIDPDVTVHGVEAAGSDSLSRSLRAGRVVDAARPNARYGGSAVKRTGEQLFDAYQQLPNTRLWQATDAEVQALADDYEDEIRYRELYKTAGFTPFEPTTLVAIAGLAQVAREYPGESVAVVGTGRNDSLEAVWR